jgi:hypothetical protein
MVKAGGPLLPQAVSGVGKRLQRPLNCRRPCLRSLDSGDFHFLLLLIKKAF